MVFAVSRPHSYAHFQIQCKRKRVFVAQVGPNTFSHRPRDPMRSGGETYRRFRSSRSGAQARGWGSGGGPSARHTGRRSRIHDCWLSECCTVPAAGWSKASLILGGVRCPRGVTLDGMDIALICWTAMLKVCEGGGQAATGRQGDRLGGWAGACPITGQIFPYQGCAGCFPANRWSSIPPAIAATNSVTCYRARVRPARAGLGQNPASPSRPRTRWRRRAGGHPRARRRTRRQHAVGAGDAHGRILADGERHPDAEALPARRRRPVPSYGSLKPYSGTPSSLP